jgi:NAD-specific glutamate dehydrogenase
MYKIIKGEKENAIKYLDLSLSNSEVNIEIVKKDNDWVTYIKDEEFNKLLNKHKKEIKKIIM